ncbi:hypothetical protein [Rhizobium lentis]|uniref:hypothetical protein n=1 Tax=Rhizobium lentis TaxID=1138194 RepID=UPI001C83FDB5|nr:hypothetical protein [Rhizobium lentis]MBX5020435.1 hypothetical protein [Rhizobium lentis]
MQIEEGKHYQTRGGQKIGPMEPTPEAKQYLWRAKLPGETSWRTYQPNGRYRDDMPCDLDIVAVWSEHASVTRSYLENAGENPPSPPELAIMALLDIVADANYSALAGVLREAHAHAASGKGSIRHGNGKDWTEQPIMEIPRLLGGSPEGQLYQIMKKAQEANGMVKRGETEAAIRELLGAINYAAAAVLTIREAA